jgi:hypothetical protein
MQLRGAEPAPLIRAHLNSISRRADMKPQARPFMVEVKGRRRPLETAHANWSTAVDEPSPDDLPGRDVREDEADTPVTAASRVFSAFATSAISSASTSGDLAASVFTPKPQEPPAETLPATADARTGRILPSLLPVNRFDDASAGQRAPVQAKAAKRRREPAAVVVNPEEAPEPSEVRADPPSDRTVSPEVIVAAERSSVRNRQRYRRRADARVRAGEGWKRRRLPKACW